MRGSMPRLLDLYAEFEDLRDRFEILAFHDPSVATLEELDEKLAPRIEEDWKGRSLPFPILLDDTQETLRAFGISGFPTHVLIDPEGRIVKGGSEALLREKLAGLRGAAKTAGDGEKPAGGG